jgi:hypothetical protein
MNADQIYQAIQYLALPERRGLIERLRDDLERATAASAAEEEELDLIGFLADDPELADEIAKIATLERAGEARLPDEPGEPELLHDADALADDDEAADDADLGHAPEEADA